MTRLLLALSLLSVSVAHAGQGVSRKSDDGAMAQGPAFVTPKSTLPKTAAQRISPKPETHKISFTAIR